VSEGSQFYPPAAQSSLHDQEPAQKIIASKIWLHGVSENSTLHDQYAKYHCLSAFISLLCNMHPIVF
jgi:hypothetical protein